MRNLNIDNKSDRKRPLGVKFCTCSGVTKQIECLEAQNEAVCGQGWVARAKERRTMSRRQNFTSGVAWMSAGIWLEQVLNFVIFAILARILGVEAFGLLAMAAAFVLFSEFLVRESISEILLTFDDLSPERLNSVFWLLMLLGVGLSTLLVLVAGPVSPFYGEVLAGRLLIGLSPTVLMIAAAAVPVAILRREMRFQVLAVRAAVTGLQIGRLS
ncbi:hypothetical protein FGK63_13075 [Ruegeria sediminis]|uniref:Lipopolysaccharide biosynthesis protein n=1 Tax=Ruegeria sediminis TaxID=2583820 RepID=A0ABY2WXQ8_9RHOB|nr:oligosaccharide flippase family protein [Ruegeria sediminis]TMV07039.1 hypothetical protein FGK63_13075 [Ruegeria sediminis]